MCRSIVVRPSLNAPRERAGAGLKACSWLPWMEATKDQPHTQANESCVCNAWSSIRKASAGFWKQAQGKKSSVMRDTWEPECMQQKERKARGAEAGARKNKEQRKETSRVAFSNAFVGHEGRTGIWNKMFKNWGINKPRHRPGR